MRRASKSLTVAAGLVLAGSVGACGSAGGPRLVAEPTPSESPFPSFSYDPLATPSPGSPDEIPQADPMSSAEASAVKRIVREDQDFAAILALSKARDYTLGDVYTLSFGADAGIGNVSVYYRHDLYGTVDLWQASFDDRTPAPHYQQQRVRVRLSGAYTFYFQVDLAARKVISTEVDRPDGVEKSKVLATLTPYPDPSLAASPR